MKISTKGNRSTFVGEERVYFLADHLHNVYTRFCRDYYRSNKNTVGMSTFFKELERGGIEKRKLDINGRRRRGVVCLSNRIVREAIKEMYEGFEPTELDDWATGHTFKYYMRCTGMPGPSLMHEFTGMEILAFQAEVDDAQEEDSLEDYEPADEDMDVKEEEAKPMMLD